MDPAKLPLKDLHLPMRIGWWPLAPGWWILIAIVAATALYLVWWFLRAHRRNRPLRHARRELNRLAAQYRSGQPVGKLVAQVSALLRRTMLAYAPRAEVAGLTGEAWLAWLDTGLREPTFSQSVGRVLLELPYRAEPGADDDAAYRDDVEKLLAAVKARLRKPVQVVNVC